ncbi:GumC family protein [Spirosoma validum]|uniref:Polysaccharide biosynthesis tyrosine autokinase n=1 Tax=Spirosoma validum TaxID=2771355 RepID=A0A927AZ24_9BACT|nr:tyrosine-protein kinase family protein [Spirosoma validum]MBD2752282.1 polysaccharide biosynthesis tyrosine autokinase [Spirosoma validum]
MAFKDTSSYVPYQVIDSNKVALRTYLAPYLRYWPLFVLSLLLALAGAYVYLLYKQPIYRIQASLLLQDEKRGNVQANPLKELDGYSPKKVVENELEVLHSSTLMESVVTSLHLDTRYYRKMSFGKREIYTESPVWMLVESGNQTLYKKPLELNFPTSETVQINNSTYPLNQSIQTPYGRLRIVSRRAVSRMTDPLLVQAMPLTAAVGMYLGNLKAEPTSKTSTVIHLTLEDAVPQKGEAILNTLINEYNQAAVTDKNKVAASTLRFVDNRLRIVSGELASVEKNVEQYKSALGITDLSEQAKSFMETTRQNDTQLNQVNIQLAVLNDLQKFISTQSDKRGSTPATVGLNDPVLLSQIEKLSQLELERDRLSQTTSAENPLLQTTDNQIKATRNNISQNIQTMKSMLTSSQQQYQAKNQKIEGSIRTMPKQERTLMDITRQQDIKNSLYTYLLQKREEMAVTFAASVADSRTIDAAKSSDGPVKPVSIVIYALFSLVGLFVPTAAITARQALNTRVSRRNDVEDGTQVPILGEVMSKRHRDVLVVAPNNRSVIAEQIRAIRTNLQLGKHESTESQVLLCTSSISGEGKSFISLNLGASLAMLRQPTVILEMDMRMPRLHQSFNINNTIGLSTYLNGEATLDEILQPVPGHPNYFIIPSGPLPPDPSELLSGPMVKQLLRLLRERFSYIILDAPPIGIVTDAQVVAPYADTTLFVVRHGLTPKHSLKTLDILYREQRFQNMRIILNAVGDGESYHSNHQYKNSYSYR